MQEYAVTLRLILTFGSLAEGNLQLVDGLDCRVVGSGVEYVTVVVVRTVNGGKLGVRLYGVSEALGLAHLVAVLVHPALKEVAAVGLGSNRYLRAFLEDVALGRPYYIGGFGRRGLCRERVGLCLGCVATELSAHLDVVEAELLARIHAVKVDANLQRTCRRHDAVDCGQVYRRGTERRRVVAGELTTLKHGSFLGAVLLDSHVKQA